VNAGSGGNPGSNGQTDPGQASAGVSSPVIDQAVTAADGTRVVARWIASSLGAIPSLAVLASIVRAPGDSGFDTGQLALGVSLAATGALLGVLAFAWVALPVPLEDKDLKNLDLRRIPGQPYTRFDQFSESLERLRAAAAQQQYDAASALDESNQVQAAAQALDATANTAQEKAAAAPGDTTLAAAAAAARADAAQADAQAKVKMAAATAAGDSAARWQAQITRRDSIRMDAYQLKASDVVRERFKAACLSAVVAVGLIAAGIVMLGIAPNTQPAPVPVSLVTLKLNKAGQHALGCSRLSIQALRTGGSPSAPTVITLPVPGCPSRTLVFTTTTQTSLGKVSVVQPTGG
jgi:hypothetical protein